jgi:hypothetical protein
LAAPISSFGPHLPGYQFVCAAAAKLKASAAAPIETIRMHFMLLLLSCLNNPL